MRPEASSMGHGCSSLRPSSVLDKAIRKGLSQGKMEASFLLS